MEACGLLRRKVLTDNGLPYKTSQTIAFPGLFPPAGIKRAETEMKKPWHRPSAFYAASVYFCSWRSPVFDSPPVAVA
jgi:hypothetical protein